MAHSATAPRADLNSFERFNIWVDRQLENRPVLATITTLALAALAIVGISFLVTATDFNPYAIAAAAVITTTTIGYSAWILSKICLLNDRDEEVRAAVRGVSNKE